MTYGPVIDVIRCTCCNRCVEICPANILFKGDNPKESPIVKYPDECFYHYGCVAVCPENPPAIRIVHPLDMRLSLRKVK